MLFVARRINMADNKEKMIDVEDHAGKVNKHHEEDPVEEIRQQAGELFRAAGDLAGSINKYANKKKNEIKNKLDNDELQEKVSSGLNSIADKLENSLGRSPAANANDITIDYVSAKTEKPSIEIEVMDDPEIYVVEGDLKESEKSALDYLRDEIKERSAENKASRATIDAEIKRLAEARANAKESSALRKIKIVDNAVSKKEEERDRRRIVEFEAAEKERLATVRSERTRDIAKKNKKPLAITAVALALAICGMGGLNAVRNNAAEAADYSYAVECIASENYDEAMNTLADLDVEDSEALYSYAWLQSDLEHYKGKPDELLQDIQAVEKEISNKDVARQCRNAEEEIELADTIQKDINSIDTSSVSAISADTVHQIEEDTEDLDKRYRPLLSTDNYTLASKVLYSIENETDAGEVILDIDNLGEITLDSKDDIDRIRNAYSGLSKEDKKLILNYGVLTSAESKYKTLKKKEDNRIAAEQKAAEEAAEQERIAAEAAAKANEQMVWVSGSGECYHSNPNCSNMRSPWEVPLSQAENMGRRPCSKCY